MPQILSRTGSTAMAGMSVGGPIGAAVGAAVGLGTSLWQADQANRPHHVYTTEHTLKNANPYGGIIQGLPQAEREGVTTMHEVERKDLQTANAVATGVDTAASILQGLPGKKVPDMPEGSGDKTALLGNSIFASQIKASNVKNDWNQMMKNNMSTYTKSKFL